MSLHFNRVTSSEKMASWFNSWWIYLWIVILSREVSADLASPPHYTINQIKASFDQATENCSPGVLTTLATKQEVTDVIGLISKLVLHQRKFTFWIGLKKAKNECVVPALPLKGFKWTEDGSEESQMISWMVEPQDTCTTTRCAALRGEFHGSTVTSLGLIAVSCKSTFGFICKLRDGQTRQTSEDRKTTVKPAALEPVTPEPKLAAPEPSKQATPEPEHPTSRPEQENDLNLTTRPDPGSGSGPASGSDLCHHPTVPGSRSITLDPKNSSRIQVECWSTGLLELRCWGHPTMWRLIDNSPANFTTICQPCSNGFRKDTSGNCVDINECSSGVPCRHTCLNTEGSYRCICPDHDKNSTECTKTINDVVIMNPAGMPDFLIPVLVAVAVLVVLVVVVLVTVKCYLMRRSKKRAMKKLEKMAMKNKDSQDSFTTANEKTAK